MDDRFPMGALRPRILLVDDDMRQRRLLHYVLEPCGYEVLEAPDG